MNVLIIYPKRDPQSPVRTQFDWQKVFELVSWPLPLRGYGLYLNVLDTLASLAPPEVNVRTINENIEEIDFGAKVDLVALTCMVTTATRGYDIADEFRKRGVPVIMGGYHPFIAHQFKMEDEVLNHVDSLCISEGDYLWPEILRDAQRGQLQRTYQQEQYTEMTSIEHRFMTSPWHWLHYGFMTIQASRGCPFHCNFCSIISMLGNKMRYKTPEAIAKELEPLYQKDILGRTIGRHLFLVDDNIYGSPKEFKRVLRAIVELNQRYPKFKPYYGSQLTINIIKDKEALELLRDAGFFYVFVGLESLDPAVLRSYEKHHNIAFDYDQAVHTLRSYGIEVVSSFIFGQDAETPAVFDQAFDFFARNHTISPYFNILVPNASQWEQFYQEGRILTKEWRLYDAQHTVFIPMKMRPIGLQRGFIDLVRRVFDYKNIQKRMIGAFVEGGSRQMLLPYSLQLFFYLKTLAALAAKRDWEAYRFVIDLRPYILKNQLSMFSIIFQIDQHDYALKNQATLAEHPYDLDIPSWEERLGTQAGEGHAAVR